MSYRSPHALFCLMAQFDDWITSPLWLGRQKVDESKGPYPPILSDVDSLSLFRSYSSRRTRSALSWAANFWVEVACVA